MPRRSTTPTMRDIAADAKVSLGTVSRVLNRYDDVDVQLRERVEESIRKLGYRLTDRTRSAVHAKAKIVGLLVVNDFRLTSAQAPLLLGIEEYCSQSGYCLLFARHQYAPGMGVPGVVQIPGLADCLIIAGSVQPEVLRSFRDYGLRYVLLRNHLTSEADPALDCKAVEYDDAGGAYQATKYLAQLGHKHIWYIGDESRSWHGNRFSGYVRAVHELNLPEHTQVVSLCDDDYENGLHAVSHILEQNWPITAILAASDQIAFGAREGLRQHRREVPKDVSLIGFEHEAGSGRASNVTSVLVDMVEVGRQLARAAIAEIEDRANANGAATIPAHLIRRSTCRPLRKEEHMIL